jgi:hypothetical protein
VDSELITISGEWLEFTPTASCDWSRGEEWRKKRVINGQEAVFVFTASRRLVVSFPPSHANFYATVRDESDMADMLFMLVTFEEPTIEGTNK